MAPALDQKNIVPNPRYDIPQHVFVAVEHPFKIVDHLKAVKSLGGERTVGRLVKAKDSDSFEVQLRLHQRHHQVNSIISGNTAAKSLVCQVTVPKLIGRKRKRRDDSLDSEIEPHGLSEQQIITTALADHGSRCEFRVLGEYKRVHRFRTMPDYVFSTQRNGFMQKFNSTIGTLEYEKTKQFKLDENSEFGKNTDLVPPPTFSQQTIPFNYVYQQNVSVKVVVGDDGEATTWNEGLAQKTLIPRISVDVEQIPTGPPSELLALDLVPQPHRDLVKEVQVLFMSRPIWTRRAIKYQLRHHKLVSSLKWSYQYVGYEFTTGPWATTIIRYGADPRKDPSFRIYQSMAIQIDPPKRSLAAARSRRFERETREAPQKPDMEDENGVPGYIFTGNTLLNDGKVWQVCDMRDPLLSTVLSTENLRSECDLASDGWFWNGTWAKAKMIFRYKARAILSGNHIWTEEEFSQASGLPEAFDPSIKNLPIDTTGWTKRSLLLAYHIKQTAGNIGQGHSQSAAKDISAAVIEELRQHDNRESNPAESGESLEALLTEEGGVLDDGDEPAASGNDDDDEDGDAGNGNENEG